MASYFRLQLEAWLRKIDIDTDSVLDIGGGANSVRDRLRSWKVKTYKILDNGVENNVVPIDYKLNLNYPISLTRSFDIIFCLEVMEYVFNPVVAVMNIYLLLKTEGVAYISFPSIYPVHNPKEIDCLRYTYQGIIKILSTAGFSRWEIVSRKATDGIGALSQFYSLEKMHPVKHDDVIYDIGYLCKCYKS
jgi:SAM-dependent methyltransferase